MNRLNRSTRWILAALVLMLATACATLSSNPTADEIQQTRRIAVKIADGVEKAGLGLEAVQLTEIDLYNAGKITAETHGNFQKRLLLTAQLVRAGLGQIQAATSRPQLKQTIQILISDLQALGAEFGPKFPGLSIGPAISAIVAGLQIMVALVG